MKNRNIGRKTAGLCIAGLWILAMAVDSASAATKSKPVFSDVPGLTPPTAAAEMPAPPATPPVATDPPAVAPPTRAASTATVETIPGTGITSSDATRGKTLYAFQAAEMELRTALATFARANDLNIVPDNDVKGTVTLDVRGLPLEQMMRALLEAADCTWQEEGGLIRVRNTETRTFIIDYLRMKRDGKGQSSATLGSGGSGGGGGGGGMGGGGMGGGGGGGMGGGGGSGGSSGSTAYSSSGSSINVTADNSIDFWKELKEEMGFVLTPVGKASMSINMTAGILQITDRPSAIKRAENYLKGVDSSIHRQVEIEAKLYDVTLNDQFQFGIDWVHLAEAYGGAMAFGGATLPVAAGSAQLKDSALGGVNRMGMPGSPLSTVPGLNLSTLVFSNFNTRAAVTALSEQGNVEVISTPRIRTLNNQTALIKVGTEMPFFSSSTSYLPGTSSATTTAIQDTTVTSITIGTILSITPQVSANDFVSLDISPVLTSLKGISVFGGSGGSSGGGGGGGSATAPELDTKQASTIVRVRDGTTVVLGGLIQTEEARSDKKIPLLGDIPYLGKLFQGTFRYKQRKELVIFVTPRIIREDEKSVNQNLPKPKLSSLKERS